VHRYQITTKSLEHDGGSLTVYNYDGVIDLTGAEPGVESPDTGTRYPVDEGRLSG
jgi:hypothetical protein